MFKRLKRFLDGDPNTIVQSEQQQLESACAVLLIEISKADGDESQVEEHAIASLVASTFELEGDALKALLEKSKSDESESTSYYPFVKLINDQYSYEKRVELVRAMWGVAAADGVIDPYEEHTIRKLADLLYVAHSDFIKTKLSVTQPKKTNE